MIISNVGSPTSYHKRSSRDHFTELDIKVILPQVPMMHFLLTGLSLGPANRICFCDMTNYTLESFAMLEILKDIIKETYIWFEILKKKMGIY